MKKSLIFSVLAFLPFLAFAQDASLQNFLRNISTFIGDTLVPFLFAIAFLAFVINAVRYFIIGAGNQESRDTARVYALYSIYAFVFLVCLWGIVNLLTNTIFGPESEKAITPDYILKSQK